MPLQDSFHAGGPRGLGGGVTFLPHSPTWQDGMGELWVGGLTLGSARGLCGGGRSLGAGLGEGGPTAACRAPPSSLPGSIRDLTPSNAAQ